MQRSCLVESRKKKDGIKAALANYKESRYTDPKLNKYQIAYHAGEDTILTISLFLPILALLKRLSTFTRQSRFKEWLDEVLKTRIKRQTNSKLSESILKKIGNTKAIQKTSNIDQLYSDAAIANRELKTATYEFAMKNKGTPSMRPENINNGLKSRERTLEKIIGEYGGDASKVLDIAGSKVKFERVDNLYDALDAFQKKYKILKFKDRIQTPLPTGYRDIIVNIEMSNGHIVEFKLVLKEMDDIAEGIGHTLYEQYRSLEAIGKTRILTDDEVQRMINLVKEQRGLYDNAWDKIILKK